MSKYNRQITGRDHKGCPVQVTVDVYSVVEAFAVTDGALQHALKKVLCAGLRGHKDLRQDLLDIRDSAARAIQMFDDNQELELKMKHDKARMF